MLPFMKAKHIASVIVERHKKDGSTKNSEESMVEEHPLLSHANNLIEAVHSKDAHKVALVLEQLNAPKKE